MGTGIERVVKITCPQMIEPTDTDYSSSNVRFALASVVAALDGPPVVYRYERASRTAESVADL